MAEILKVLDIFAFDLRVFGIDCIFGDSPGSKIGAKFGFILMIFLLPCTWHYVLRNVEGNISVHARMRKNQQATYPIGVF